MEKNYYLYYFILTLILTPIKQGHPLLEDFLNISGLVCFFIYIFLFIKEKVTRKYDKSSKKH